MPDSPDAWPCGPDREMATTDVVLSTQIDRDDIDRLVAALREGGRVRLSFHGETVGPWVQDEPTAKSWAQRSSPVWPVAMSNLLLVEFGAVPLDIVLPWDDNRTMSMLERNGLPYALARRPGPTTIGPANLVDRIEPWLDPCRPLERRVVRSFDGLISGVDRITRDTQTTLKLHPWLLSDPHRTYRRNRFPGALPYPWVDDFLPKPIGQAALATRDQLVPLLRGVLKELIENADRHAFRPSDRPVDRLDLLSGLEHSVAMASLTKGGNRSYDRAHVLVLDSGVGIPRTIRPKLPVEVQTTISARRLVERAIMGEWDGVDPSLRDVDGNNGLNWCREELAPYSADSRLLVISESDEGDGFVVVGVDGSGNLVSDDVANVPLRGTVGVLSIGLTRDAVDRSEGDSAAGSAAGSPAALDFLSV